MWRSEGVQHIQRVGLELGCGGWNIDVIHWGEVTSIRGLVVLVGWWLVVLVLNWLVVLV